MVFLFHDDLPAGPKAMRMSKSPMYFTVCLCTGIIIRSHGL